MAGTALRIERRTLDHPDAVRLIEEVQGEYVVRYGGPDESPMDPAEFAPGAGAFFVGYLAGSGEAVATGAWRWRPVPVPVPGVPEGPCAEIKRMYVAAGHRHHGHARAMLAHLERTAREAGARTMVLETGIRQPEAIALYESSGYRPVAAFGYYADSPSSRYLGKPLTPVREVTVREVTGGLE